MLSYIIIGGICVLVAFMLLACFCMMRAARLADEQAEKLYPDASAAVARNRAALEAKRRALK